MNPPPAPRSLPHSLQVEGLPGFKKINPLSKRGLYVYAAVEFAGCKPMKTTKVAIEGAENITVRAPRTIPASPPLVARRPHSPFLPRPVSASRVVACGYNAPPR